MNFKRKTAIVAMALGLAGATAMAQGMYCGGNGSGFSFAQAGVSLGAEALSLNMASNQTIKRTRAPVEAAMMTITDAATPQIKAATDIRISIPQALPFMWNQTNSQAVFGGTAASKVNTTVSYENAGKTLRINVETDFASQDTLTVSGLSFTNLIQACFPERLCMDIHNDGKTDAFCNSATCVTVKRRGTIGDGGASASMLSNKRLIIWEGTVITGQ